MDALDPVFMLLIERRAGFDKLSLGCWTKAVFVGLIRAGKWFNNTDKHWH